MAVLGIRTNTRLLGIAIIQNGVLLDYSIRLNKSPWSPAKVSEIITSLEPCVLAYSIKRVCLSIPPKHHQNKAIRELYAAIKAYFLKNHIPVREIKQSEVQYLCPPDRKKTKKCLMETLTVMYPQLTLCFKKEMRNKNRYYVKLFEAVAAATAGE